MLKTLVIGHLGKDAVINHVNGRTVINFTIAHTEKYKDQQGAQHEKTTWVDCSYWTDRTALAPWLLKGKQVFVEGTPEVKQYQRNDGTYRASFALRVREVQLLGGGGNQQRPQQQQQYTGTGSHIPNPNDITEPIEDLPF